MLFLSLCFCWGLSLPIPSFLLSASLPTHSVVFNLPFSFSQAFSPSLFQLYSSLLVIFPVRGALCCLLLSFDLRCWHSVLSARPSVCGGEAVFGQTGAHACPRHHKGSFLCPSMASINAGPSASGGDVRLPEMAHREGHYRGRKPGAGASWDCCQGRDGGVKRAWGGVLCSKPSAVYVQTHTHKRTHLFFAWIQTCMQACACPSSGSAGIRSLKLKF